MGFAGKDCRVYRGACCHVVMLWMGKGEGCPSRLLYDFTLTRPLRSMRFATALVSILLGTVLLLPAPASAQVSVTPYAGYSTAYGYSFDYEEAFDDDEEEGEFSTQGGGIIGVSAELALPFSSSLNLSLQPAIEAGLLSGNEFSEDSEFRDQQFTATQHHLKVSGNLIAEFGDVNPALTPYAGLGLSYALYAYTEKREVTSDGGTNVGYISQVGTSFGVNILGGVRFPNVVEFGVPFVQLRATVGSPTPDAFTDPNVDFEGSRPDELGTPITLTAGVSFDL